MAANNMRLRVVLDAVEKVTAPLKRVRKATGQASQAMKETRNSLRDLQRQQSDVTSYRKSRVAIRQNNRALNEARQNQQQYTEQLNRQRDVSNSAQSALKVARREYDQLAKQVQQTSQPTRALTNALEQSRLRFTEQQRAADTASRTLTTYRDRVTNTDQRIKQLTQTQNNQQQRLQGLRARLDEAGISTDNLGRSAANMRTREQSLNSTLEQQKRQLADLNRQQERLNQSRQRYQSQRAAVGSVAGAGGSMLARGAIGGYAEAKYLGVGAKFDSTMARVQALSRLDSGDDQLAQIRAQARQMGASTMLTSSQVGEGQAFLAQAGFNPKAIIDSMPGIANMSLAGGMDLGETADIGSNILTAMKLPAEQMTRVADTMTAAFTRSNTSISTLGETMKYAAPGASQFGVDLETTTAMAAKLGDAGIQGSMGGTSIRRMLSRLASPTAAARKALDKLNVSTENAEGGLRDMPTLLKEIYDASRNMGDVERGSLWKEIAGETGSSAMGILVDQAGDGNLQGLIGELRNSTGEAANVAKVQSDNFAGDWNQLKSAWEDTGIEVFEQLNGWLRNTAQGITNVIRSVGDWMRANPELTQTIGKIVIIGTALMTLLGSLSLAIAGLLGPLVLSRFLLSQVGINIGSVTGSFKALIPTIMGATRAIAVFLATNPIGWAILAVSAVILIYKYWEPIKAFFTGLWEEITADFANGWEGIKELILNFSPLGWFYRIFQPVLSWFGIDLPEKFSDFGHNLMQGLVDGIKGMASSVKDAVTGMGSATMDWFKNKLGIHSPSRVFEDYGLNINQGLANGIIDSADEPLGKAQIIARQIAGIGAGLTIGAGSSAALADPIQFDTRPPLQGGISQQTPVNYNLGNINIEINAAPSMDEQALARLVNDQVRKALLEAERRAQSASRRNLYDNT